MKQALVLLCLVLGCVMATPVAPNIDLEEPRVDGNQEPSESFIAQIQEQVEGPRASSVNKREARENGTKRGRR